MERRTFLSWFSVGWVASSLPMALAACSQPEKKLSSLTPATNTTANSPRSDGFSPAGTVAQLNKDGQIFNQQSPVGSVLVVRTAANAISAVDPTCTHKGCIVKLRTNQQDLMCPCHDARFATDGKILEGPARLPLATYDVKLEGNLVLVKAKEKAVSGAKRSENTQGQSSH